MGLRFNKRIKIAKGVNLNLSKSGIGVSAGVKGARVGVGPCGTRVTTSIPGTGISNEWRSKKSKGSRNIASEAYSEPPALPSPHNRWVTLLVCALLGWLGVHRFLVGKIGSGLLYLVTFGFFGIGWCIDFLLILLGVFTDRQRRILR